MADFKFRVFSNIVRKLIDLGDGTHAPEVIARPPEFLLTGENDPEGMGGGTTRLRVDVAQTSFFEGKQFRTFYDFSIASGNSIVIKADAPLDVVLFAVLFDLVSGSILVETIAGGTEGGSFDTPLPVIPVNNMDSRPLPYYVPEVSVSTGGTITGGTLLDVFRGQTSGVGNQAQSVGAGGTGERGANAGLYYYRITAGSGTAAAVFHARWEERPEVS